MCLLCQWRYLRKHCVTDECLYLADCIASLKIRIFWSTWRNSRYNIGWNEQATASKNQLVKREIKSNSEKKKSTDCDVQCYTNTHFSFQIDSTIVIAFTCSITISFIVISHLWSRTETHVQIRYYWPISMCLYVRSALSTCTLVWLYIIISLLNSIWATSKLFFSSKMMN